MIALAWASLSMAGEAMVTVPLDTWNSAASSAPVAPGVALGAARYSGSADPVTMTLDLHLALDVSLTGDGRKLVPLLGEQIPLERGRGVGQDAVGELHGRLVGRSHWRDRWEAAGSPSGAGRREDRVVV